MKKRERTNKTRLKKQETQPICANKVNPSGLPIRVQLPDPIIIQKRHSFCLVNFDSLSRAVNRQAGGEKNGKKVMTYFHPFDFGCKKRLTLKPNSIESDARDIQTPQSHVR